MRKETVLIALLLFALTIVSEAPAGSGIKTIHTTELHSMVVDNAYMLEKGREQQFIVIDARTKEEYDRAHIFSAISIPEKDFPESINLLPQNKNILLVVYCNGMQSETGRKWARKAAASGYTNISIYAEGFSVWWKKKMPVAALGIGTDF
jgi:rhodanese-related sulfurtransferase